jgi:hypothetical protein
MKSKLVLLAALCFVALSLGACKKKKCADCHYDKAGAEIELGEKCGDEMGVLEANGYTDSTGTYVVHCAH